MKKLFNVVADMDNMSMDQLKGAIRNMERVGDTLYTALETLFKDNLGDPTEFSVLNLNVEDFPEQIDCIYLPAIDGGTVSVPTDRPDNMIMWKLEFFAEYGNMKLDATYTGNIVHMGLLGGGSNLMKYMEKRQVRERQMAVNYEVCKSIKTQ